MAILCYSLEGGTLEKEKLKTVQLIPSCASMRISALSCTEKMEEKEETRGAVRMQTGA